jgi:hypothetical protein
MRNIAIVIGFNFRSIYVKKYYGNLQNNKQNHK